MKDIYLSYTQETFELSQHLKDDIESSTNLLVALENDDWEEEGDASDEFQEHLESAKHCLVLISPSGNVTAWIMDPNITEIQPGFQRPRDISLPPQINFRSYEKGLDIFLYILKVVTGSGDIKMDPKHEKIAVKEERTVSSEQFSSRITSPRRRNSTVKKHEQTRSVSSSKRPRESPRQGFVSPVKKFQRLLRKRKQDQGSASPSATADMWAASLGHQLLPSVPPLSNAQ